MTDTLGAVEPRPQRPAPSPPPSQPFVQSLREAVARRAPLIAKGHTAYRAFAGRGDGIEGVYVDVYGPGAVLIVHEGRAASAFDPDAAAAATLEALQPQGVSAVYIKRFARDRSKLGGELPADATDAAPAAGAPLPESIIIREHDWNLEVRLFDGLSTGLFLDQRDNRKFVHRWTAARKREQPEPVSVLNTFAYTCAFSVAAALARAHTTSVDVSGRYLDWGKRNFTHNALAPDDHRFARMDTFEFFAYARRKALTYDLIILDPPSFAAGSRPKKIRPWSATADYARLVQQAAGLLRPRGVIFASTNTLELCRPGRLEREVTKGLGNTPHWLKLPPLPSDFSPERGRFAACAFPT